jgi:phosphoglycolate phosphatase
MKPCKGIIFDLDGTLLDTLPFIARCGNRVLQQNGFATHEMAAFSSFIGQGLRTLTERMLPHEVRHDRALVDRLTSQIKSEYAKIKAGDIEPYSGILLLLQRLHEADLKLAVLTNKVHEHAVHNVEMFLGGQYFELVVGASDHRPLKPHPAGALEILRAFSLAPADVVVVGDMEIDIFTAQQAGLRSVGVTWGFGSRDTLRAAPADEIIDEPAELLSLLQISKDHE